MRTPAAFALLALSLIIAACTPAADLPPAPASPTEPPPGFALPPAWTATPPPTEAPPTPTRTPTPPAGLAWATPHPADDVYEDWTHYQGKSASLWLPPGFVVADLGEFGDMMALMAYAMTEAMGELAASLASPVPGRPTPTLVSLEELQRTLVFDLALAGNEAEDVGLFLIGEPPEEGVELEAVIESVIGGFEGEITIDAQHAILGRPAPTARLVVSGVDPETGRSVGHLVYVFVVNDRAWQLLYSAPAESFDGWLPLFEKSAASFVLTGA